MKWVILIVGTIASSYCSVVLVVNFLIIPSPTHHNSCLYRSTREIHWYPCSHVLCAVLLHNQHTSTSHVPNNVGANETTSSQRHFGCQSALEGRAWWSRFDWIGLWRYRRDEDSIISWHFCGNVTNLLVVLLVILGVVLAMFVLFDFVMVLLRWVVLYCAVYICPVRVKFASPHFNLARKVCSVKDYDYLEKLQEHPTNDWSVPLENRLLVIELSEIFSLSDSNNNG